MFAHELCGGSQLHPWLVPHSVQQPQAPARMTLLEPQFEQVISIYILPSAVCTRSACVLPAWAMCGSPSLPFLCVITSMIPGVSRGNSATGRLIAFLSISASSFIGRSACARFGDVASL